MKTIPLLVAGLVGACLLAGCGDKDPTASNYTKDAFKKTPPPAGWMDSAKKSSSAPAPPAGK